MAVSDNDVIIETRTMRLEESWSGELTQVILEDLIQVSRIKFRPTIAFRLNFSSHARCQIQNNTVRPNWLPRLSPWERRGPSSLKNIYFQVVFNKCFYLVPMYIKTAENWQLIRAVTSSWPCLSINKSRIFSKFVGYSYLVHWEIGEFSSRRVYEPLTQTVASLGGGGPPRVSPFWGDTIWVFFLLRLKTHWLVGKDLIFFFFGHHIGYFRTESQLVLLRRPFFWSLPIFWPIKGATTKSRPGCHYS